MPNAGDTFTTTLREAHLGWGVYRHTNTRPHIEGEAYLQIPRREAERLGIYNSNQPNAIIEYTCSSVDGYLVNELLKACGCSKAGDVYAKQFEGSGNLKLLGGWFSHINAQVGDQVKITWVSNAEITIERI